MSSLIATKNQSYTFKLLPKTDVEKAFALEISNYPEDEAASLEGLVYRQKEAGLYFLGCYSPDKTLIGYVCSTRVDKFDHDSLAFHFGKGGILAIHSVCVSTAYHRLGIGSLMLNKYVELITSRQDESLKRIALMAKVNLIPFYTKASFKCLGLSSIVHGKEQWFDLQLELTPSNAARKYVTGTTFSTVAGNGNPAGCVFFIGEDEWMQNVAVELNLNMTAFIKLNTDEEERGIESVYDIRFFNGKAEFPVCGHATLFTALVSIV